MRLRAAALACLAALGGSCTGSDQPAASGSTNTTAGCHEGDRRLSPDVDGDGRPDIAWQASIDGRLQVGVCTAAGALASLDVGGMGEGRFDVIDVEADGIDELISGGTSVSQVLSEVIVMRAGRLIAVPGIQLAEGPAEFTPAGTPSRVDAWRCADADGDGVRDLVLISVVRRDQGATETSTAYRIATGRASAISRTTVELPSFPEGGYDVSPAECRS